ncbi:hypothetical protein JAAARDRAFT_320384 [Jaapia argillacea MUCL 33604]|uniref:Uncharacterized protein n=1 Tax=Jaapia argillacea MUCL 33604 TaxID=933084 RepID=A0A067PXU0_9AGAM|nr:hypothetical protein JAAARDRAFT_320384 [Jaapia argillacea MUCL 33604]
MSTSDILEIHASLASLSAPEITLKDLERIYKGPFAEALKFLVEHVKGRSATAAARQQILSFRQSRSHISRSTECGLDDDFLQANATRSALNGVKINYTEVQQALERKIKALEILRGDIEHLQSVLDNKIVVDMLLDILQKKEVIRMKRFAHIASLLQGQCRAIEDHHALGPTRSPNLPIEARQFEANRLSNSYTRDTLGSLHGHHIRLASLQKQHSITRSDADQQLIQALARAMHLPHDHPKVVAAFENCRSVAQTRARTKTRYHSPLPNEVVSDPKEIAEQMRADEQSVQAISDEANALIMACQQDIQLLSTFTQNTSNPLREALLAEAAGVKQYVDIFQWSISSSEPQEQVSKSSLLTQAASTCGLAGQVDLDSLLQHIERTTRDAHERRAFLANARIIDASLARFQKDEVDVDNKIIALLSRKIEKVQRCDSMVIDVENLVREMSLVGTLGR